MKNITNPQKGGRSNPLHGPRMATARQRRSVTELPRMLHVPPLACARHAEGVQDGLAASPTDRDALSGTGGLLGNSLHDKLDPTLR